jgi:hypothetical protein
MYVTFYSDTREHTMPKPKSLPAKEQATDALDASFNTLLTVGFSKPAAQALLDDALLREMVEAAVAVSMRTVPQSRQQCGPAKRLAKPKAPRPTKRLQLPSRSASN